MPEVMKPHVLHPAFLRTVPVCVEIATAQCLKNMNESNREEMPPMNLASIDELIHARRELHGGERGAPIKLDDGSREGAAINRACVVLLSATLQAYVSDVFLSCSNKAFGHDFQEQALENYRATWSRWGNASPANIVRLFRRLGVDDIFTGLSWQGQATNTLKRNLDTINQVRNRIAHGGEIRVNGANFSLTLNHIERWRRVSETFGQRFRPHALAKF